MSSSSPSSFTSSHFTLIINKSTHLKMFQCTRIQVFIKEELSEKDLISFLVKHIIIAGFQRIIPYLEFNKEKGFSSVTQYTMACYSSMLELTIVYFWQRDSLSRNLIMWYYKSMQTKGRLITLAMYSMKAVNPSRLSEWLSGVCGTKTTATNINTWCQQGAIEASLRDNT